MADTQYKLVPVEPTEAMLKGVPLIGAIWDTEEGAEFAANARQVYTAMLQAAPEPPADLIEAAQNVVMYLDGGFISCPRCREEISTTGTDGISELRQALSSINGDTKAKAAQEGGE